MLVPLSSATLGGVCVESEVDETWLWVRLTDENESSLVGFTELLFVVEAVAVVVGDFTCTGKRPG